MKPWWIVACLLVAWDSAEKAMGVTPQELFAPDLIWVWWFAAGGWAFAAAYTAVIRYERA
jgi:hypothetical protein